MKDHVSLQERLKDLRVEKGLKLEELAEKTGISKSALASYENEENRNKEINLKCYTNVVTGVANKI
jgi:transcriptional regulator with XRE-family HTH domain